MQPPSPVTVQIPQEWSEFIGLLRKYEARFLLIGAHALAAFGRPRYTGDFDIFVDPDSGNLQRVWNALRDFVGVGEDVLEPLLAGKIIQIGNPPMRLDVIPKIDGVTFAEAWAGCIPVRLNEHGVNMIGRTEYIKNKKAAGRDKDLLDVALLEEVGMTSGATARNLSEYDPGKTSSVKLRRPRTKARKTRRSTTKRRSSKRK